MQAASFTSASSALHAMLAGKAKITLVSKASGARFTYRICRAERPDQHGIQPYFVSLLSGPDNDHDFVYIGMLRPDLATGRGFRFSLTAKSRVSADAPSVKAITWTVASLYTTDRIPEKLEVWHEGCCCRCGRTLTVPESLATGLGPECAKKEARAA